MFSYLQVISLLKEREKLSKVFKDLNQSKPFVYPIYCKDCKFVFYQIRCCGNMFCNICNLKISIKLGMLFKYFQEKNKFLKPVFITLTYKNIDSITKDIFKQYRKQFTKNFLRQREVKKILVGGVYSFDYTINKENQDYNIHLHLLGFCKKYFPQSLLSDKWLLATKNSFIVDIRKINNIEMGIFEVVKYVQSNKILLSVEGEKRDNLINELKKIRRFSKFGSCYKQKLEKKDMICKNCKSDNLIKKVLIQQESFYDEDFIEEWVECNFKGDVL